ncbi:hypothetical protein ACHAWC_005208 [Mediolabrus comicus]
MHNDDSIISRREEDETSRSASSADGGNHSNVATATTDIYSSNFPWGQGVGQQMMGMPVNYNLMAGGFTFWPLPTYHQSGFFQHSNAPSGNQQIEPAAEIIVIDNEDDATMDNPSFDQSEESTQPKNPTEQASVHDNSLRGQGVGQQMMGMPVNYNLMAGGFTFWPLPTYHQSGFFQHSNAPSGNQQIEPAAEIIVIDNEDDATMDNPSFDQSEESTQPKNPTEQASVHDNSLPCREGDETGIQTSSSGAGSNREDEIPEAKEIKGMAAETEEDNSFGGGVQNDDFRTESDVSSEEGRQSDLAQSTKGSGGESEIQRLKDQLKETQKRLKESEEDKKQQRKEYESKVEVLEEENVRLKKKLKVSVQTNADLLEAALENMKIVHEPEVIRQLAEEGLMECLRNHKVDIGQSKIEGARFGAFAMAKISAGERIFHFNGAPSSETISLTEDKIAKLPSHAQRVVRMYTQPDDDGVRDVPKNGFSFALGISWYLNSAKGTEFEANVEVGPNLDESGFAELIALRDIEPGEELLDSYEVGDTL